MESTDYTKFTHPKDCTPAIVNIERCWNGDANRIRLTVPGVQSALVFDKIRFRAILKDDACALSANPLPVKGMAHSPVYGHVVITGRMLYEEEAVLPFAGNTRPFTLEILPQNTTIDGTAYDTVQALYDALQAVITDCDCICTPSDEDCEAVISAITYDSESEEFTILTEGSIGNYVRMVIYDNDDVVQETDWVANGTPIVTNGLMILEDTTIELEVSNNAEDVCASVAIEVQYFTANDFDGDESYTITEEYELPSCEGGYTFNAVITTADELTITDDEITLENADPDTTTLLTATCAGQVIAILVLNTANDTPAQARFIGMYLNKFLDTGSADTTGSTGAFVRWAVERDGGNDPDVTGSWIANTGSINLALDMAELLHVDTTAIKVQVSNNAVAVDDEVIAPIILDSLYLPKPAVDFDYPTNAFYAPCGGSNSFGQALLQIATDGGGPINAVSGKITVDSAALAGQFSAVFRLCDGDIDNVLFITPLAAAVRVASFKFADKEIGATATLPASGYTVLLQYSDNGIAYANCDGGTVPYNGVSQTDIYGAGAVNLGGFLKAIFTRTNVAGLTLTYTDVKQIPFPQIIGGNGPGTYAFSFVASGVDSSHADYTGHSFRDVKLNITGGTYAGIHAIPDFAGGGTPDISGLPAGLQALLVASPNLLSIMQNLWLVEGATSFSLSCVGTNEYGAIIISSSTVTGSYTP